jgi:uncharacterized protein YigE (DUF2233 family)
LLAACSEQKAGEPVVTVNLKERDGEEIVPVPPDSPIAATLATSAQSACSPASFEGVALTHCLADPARHSISVVYGPGDGSAAYGTLAAFAESADASAIAFAMNGGAFSDDLSPRGYLVVSGERLSQLDRSEGEGNFYLKPNGVFFGGKDGWRVLTTERFFRTVRDRPAFGTQSGPMLLVNGELGASISANGTSRTVRNAVGVDTDGRAHFVISNAAISYGELARYMRDELGVTDALFLDANSSSLWDPATGRLDEGRTGPILVVSKKDAP